MTKEKAVLLFEEPSPYPKERLAARYMRRELDRQLEHLWSEQPINERLLPNLTEHLNVRYGLIGAKVEKKGDLPLIEAVEDAFKKYAEPQTSNKFGSTYQIKWDSERAINWFQGRLEESWPEGVEPHFFAEDVHTLWTAVIALDLAAVGKDCLADDLFPAPPVLIIGPTGTGKELLARAIHAKANNGSLEHFGPLNCGGLPTEILESELFGHKKGSFTGANSNKEGFVEIYDTIFLDEVGDTPTPIQVRLLRFLNTGEYKAVGCNKIKRVCPRIISATHVNLEKYIEDGRFREDLYHRLNGRELRLCALSERTESIPRLLYGFIRKAAKQSGAEPAITQETIRALQAYHWPGNMREMKYLMGELLEASYRDSLLTVDHLPDNIISAYRSQVSPQEQDMLQLLATQQKGESKEKIRLRTALMVSFRFDFHKEHVGIEISQASAFLHKLSQVLGLEDQAKPFIDVLGTSYSLEFARSFREEWIEKLEHIAKQQKTEINEVLAIFREYLSKLEENARKNQKLFEKTDPSDKVLAFPAAVATLLPLIQRLPPNLLDEYNGVLDRLSFPPFDAGAKAFGLWIRHRKPQEVLEAISAFLGEEKFESINDDEDYDLEWGDVKNDLSALEELVQEHRGNVAATARSLGIERETLSRRISKLKKENSQNSLSS